MTVMSETQSSALAKGKGQGQTSTGSAAADDAADVQVTCVPLPVSGGLSSCPSSCCQHYPSATRTDSSFRVFRGRRRFAARNTRTMHLEDLPALTDFMLRSSFFQCGTLTFKQIQGASMGSALAPVLCTLVASTTEFLWLHNFRNVLLSIGLHTAVRYADNRAFHFHTGTRHNPWTQLLLHLEFYGAPILLEDVPEEKFLGTICWVTQGAITTLQPVDATLLRALKSVGNQELRWAVWLLMI